VGTFAKLTSGILEGTVNNTGWAAKNRATQISPGDIFDLNEKRHMKKGRRKPSSAHRMLESLQQDLAALRATLPEKPLHLLSSCISLLQPPIPDSRRRRMDNPKISAASRDTRRIVSMKRVSLA
jgi:hypothetical protein